MSFFQNLGKKVGEAAQGVKSKTDELAAVAKLNKSIADETKKIQQAYTNLGMKVYDLYKQSGEIDDLFADNCQIIKMAEDAIAVFKEQILEIKNIKKCPDCGTESLRDVQFCPKCGHKFTVAAPQAPQGEAGTKVCPACNTESPSDSAFCISCGTKL